MCRAEINQTYNFMLAIHAKAVGVATSDVQVRVMIGKPGRPPSARLTGNIRSRCTPAHFTMGHTEPAAQDVVEDSGVDQRDSCHPLLPQAG
ncbi:hypothetical protein Mvan_2534 [Mycolicibacterium vanbaalenii PYR-1]|uniref:Uncharacterized protein n=1 Tax=Mycolicibacterium vanbaalenii (strain DSM 7251 / JCM 13017 / BCRC 16820 / KCTC 9966 / NRRL B-24157 / PYR-1) TaxID=350058 RepID=A1T845_MYCVP|nr:hypothetical protein Mvan_2534 [Mycolicibacterium vanbaalenii PYR-1]